MQSVKATSALMEWTVDSEDLAVTGGTVYPAKLVPFRDFWGLRTLPASRRLRVLAGLHC